MDELWRLIKLENHEAVRIGDLEKEIGGDQSCRAQAVVREGVDQLTLRRVEEGTLRTLHRCHQCGAYGTQSVRSSTRERE